MDKDLAAEYAEALKANPLLDKLICAMEEICYTNIRNTSIVEDDIMRDACLNIKCINNFRTLVKRTIENKKVPAPANIKKIMSID